ncbi:hypothetical protein [Sneathiella aquimaris]|uniref:hypothetical protein n=1 Tax=Sneathiella aquimaris TaxID=2599305 RepID=UPI00146A1133|nr:hypothetical protein [Sneathiella aquimaris]
MSIQVAAEENKTFKASNNTDAHKPRNETTAFTIDTVAANKIETEKAAIFSGVDFDISYSMPVDSFLRNDVFGSTPIVSFGFGYLNGSSYSSQVDTGNNANSALTVEGAQGGNWGTALGTQKTNIQLQILT